MTQIVRIEDGVVVGTSGGKYDSANPVARYLLGQFDRAISDLAAHVSPSSVLEVGCGEGHVTKLLLEATEARILATDLSASMVAEAEKTLCSDRVTYQVLNVMSLEATDPPPDLVVCCEVLEHLDEPDKAIEKLRALGARSYLLSVPREPIWRALNMSRGAYLKEFGNSPGHLQHWSKRGFLSFIEGVFEPIIVRSPLPWTVVLCRPRNGHA